MVKIANHKGNPSPKLRANANPSKMFIGLIELNSNVSVSGAIAQLNTQSNNNNTAVEIAIVLRLYFVILFKLFYSPFTLIINSLAGLKLGIE